MMTDFDEDLRELLHEKARDANVTPELPGRVASHGRRRQIGTALLAAATAALIVAASVVVLRSVHTGRTETPLSEPGGSNGLGERTATIKGVTITAPAGWTLIDLWSGRTSISATAAGATGSPPSTATMVEVPAPVLELAAEDPGLDASACVADATLPPTQAVMVVVLGSAPDLTKGPAGSIPTGPVPLDPAATSAPQSGPCGQGIYGNFTLGSTPYFAYFGLGSEVSDGDRSALFDAYNGMQASAAPLTGLELAAGTGPSYVMAAGVERGVAWRLEIGPCVARPTATTAAASDMGTACLTILTGDGANAGQPFSGSSAAGPLGGGSQVGERILVPGAVLPNTSAVEYRSPGQEPVAATILDVPDSYRSSIAALPGGGDVPARLFWMLVDKGDSMAETTVVQLAADGSVLSSQELILVLLPNGASPTPSPASPSPST